MVSQTGEPGKHDKRGGHHRVRGGNERRGVHGHIQQVEPLGCEESVPVLDVPARRDHTAASRRHDLRESGESDRAAPIHVHTERGGGRVARARHLQPLSQAHPDPDARHTAHDGHSARPRSQRRQQVSAHSTLPLQHHQLHCALRLSARYKLPQRSNRTRTRALLRDKQVRGLYSRVLQKV